MAEMTNREALQRRGLYTNDEEFEAEMGVFCPYCCMSPDDCDGFDCYEAALLWLDAPAREPVVNERGEYVV